MGEMVMNSTANRDIVRFSVPVSARASADKINVTLDSDEGMRIDAPKTANTKRVPAKAKTPPSMARTSSTMETARFGHSNKMMLLG